MDDQVESWRDRGAGYAGHAAAAVNDDGNLQAATVSALLAIYCELRQANDERAADRTS